MANACSSWWVAALTALCAPGCGPLHCTPQAALLASRLTAEFARTGSFGGDADDGSATESDNTGEPWHDATPRAASLAPPPPAAPGAPPAGGHAAAAAAAAPPPPAAPRPSLKRASKGEGDDDALAPPPPPPPPMPSQLHAAGCLQPRAMDASGGALGALPGGAGASPAAAAIASHHLLMAPSHELSFDSADSAQDVVFAPPAAAAMTAADCLLPFHGDYHGHHHAKPDAAALLHGLPSQQQHRAAAAAAAASLGSLPCPSPIKLPGDAGFASPRAAAVGPAGGSPLALHGAPLQQQQQQQQGQQHARPAPAAAAAAALMAAAAATPPQRAGGAVRRQPSDLLAAAAAHGHLPLGAPAAASHAAGNGNAAHHSSSLLSSGGTLASPGPSRPGSVNPLDPSSGLHLHLHQHQQAGGGGLRPLSSGGAQPSAAAAGGEGVSLRAVAARAALWVPGMSRYAGVLAYVDQAPREALPAGLGEALQGLGWAVDRAADEAAAADAALAAVHQVRAARALDVAG